jgi:hypothetical protein
MEQLERRRWLSLIQKGKCGTAAKLRGFISLINVLLRTAVRIHSDCDTLAHFKIYG